MHLIKDLVDGRIVYYWLDVNERPLSTFFSTFKLAEEWWKEYMFSQYAGEERRRSIIDRRTNEEKRKRLQLNNRFVSINPNGRRTTDKPIRVDRDLVAEKLQSLATE